MTPASVKVPGRSLDQWLREICFERRTGRLDLAAGSETTSLYFVGGDLYLAPEHRVFEAAKAWVDESGVVVSAEEEPENDANPWADRGLPLFRQLAGLILDTSGPGEDSDLAFVKGADHIRVDLVGPLPTRQLLMEAAVRGRDDRGLLRRLGGEKVSLKASSTTGALPAGVNLDPEEAFLLSRLEHSVTVGDLLQQLDLGRSKILRSLCRLQAVDLIVGAGTAGERSTVADTHEDLFSRFEQKIRESLGNEPLTVKPEQHKELLGNLLSRMGEMTHFELLAVTPLSAEDEIHQAYFELGRLVHPDHATTLGLAGKEGAFSVLFERATEAYLTLSDPDRKARYCAEIGPIEAGPTEEPDSGPRHEEQQDMARRNYEMALGLAGRQDFHSAIQLLEQAVKVDPQAEYLTLLGDCQAENPQWLDRAAVNYERAIRARPGDPSLYTRLGRVHERRGAASEAKDCYETALKIAPQHEGARAGALRVGGEAPEARGSRWFDRLLALVRGW